MDVLKLSSLMTRIDRIDDQRFDYNGLSYSHNVYLLQIAYNNKLNTNRYLSVFLS